MGNYDLGAALFAEKFQREIRMVRAPEPDRETARHLDETLEKTGSGAVRVDYTTDTTSLSFDLLRALRENEIVSIQGDRVVGNAARSFDEIFGHEMLLCPPVRLFFRRSPRLRSFRSSSSAWVTVIIRSLCASRSFAREADMRATRSSALH